MKVLAFKIGSTEKRGEVIEIENKLEAMQKFLGGYIETITMPNGLLVVCDEEGKLKNYPHCVDITMNGCTVSFVGNVFICGNKGDEMRGLSDEEIKYMQSVIVR